jgi:tRNA(fMet)-specific endonuclease VapC
MTLYVLDTDHLSLYERNHPSVNKRIRQSRQSDLDTLATTIITTEEQCAGRLAQIRKATTSQSRTDAYARLKKTVVLFCEIVILDYDLDADDRFYTFQQARIRVGTQDLRIAAITLACSGILCTRNRRDFEKIPGLIFEDWSI